MSNQRLGQFTSSEVHKLIKKGTGNKPFSAAGETYIQAKRYEKKIGRSLNTETNAKPISWGNYFEKYCFDNIGLEWQLVSKTRWTHPTLPWSGMPDVISKDGIGDIKSPYTLLSFCQQLECFGDIEKYRQEVPEYYWQLVSNAILCDKNIATAILFMPKLSDITIAKEDIVANYDSYKNISWFLYAEQNEIPYLPDECTIPNVNEWTFEVPEEDKLLLIDRIKLASELI